MFTHHRNHVLNQWGVAGLLFLGALAPLRAADIPLQKGGDKGTRVGFVDMEKIFREYPETQKARGEYFKELERRRQDVADKERRLSLMDVPLASTGTVPVVSTAPAPTPLELAMSTAPVVSPAVPLPVDPAMREAEKQKLKEDLAAARQQAARSLKEFEEKRSVQILGSLYKALTQLADERGIDVVVDKSAILYGQSAVDLTEALSRRIRGVPDETK